MPSEFSLTLFQNAVDSLDYGLAHLRGTGRPTDLKWAAQMTYQGVSLLLKAALAYESEDLIFEDPKQRWTISGERALELLTIDGHVFDKDGTQGYERLRHIRRALEHHELTDAEEGDIRSAIACAAALAMRAAEIMDTILPDELSTEATTVLEGLQEVRRAAEAHALAFYRSNYGDPSEPEERLLGSDELWCPECLAFTILEDDHEVDAPFYCALCQRRFGRSYCFICHGSMVGTVSGSFYWDSEEGASIEVVETESVHDGCLEHLLRD